MSANVTGKKTASLLGRLGVQLKLIDMEQLREATAEQGRHPGKSLGEILVELGFINEKQLAKLTQVQRDVIAKHREKKAQTGRSAPPPPQSATVSEPESPLEAIEQAPSPQPKRAPAVGTGVSRSAQPPPGASALKRPTSFPRPQLRESDEALSDLELPLSAGGEAELGQLQRILQQAVEAGASDVHVHAGAPMRMRVNGQLVEGGGPALDASLTEGIVGGALSQQDREDLARTGELDVCITFEGIGRFRTNLYRQQSGFDAVFRVIPPAPPTLEQLGLPNALAKFINYHQGMVLITGPAGCGKSATMAALVRMINEERDEHILTIEDPIEYVHAPARCLVNQRHAGRHTTSFARALRGALREDPDVIVIGELRDLETISLAMTAAETGHFVLATLHTNNAVRTINRMIGAFPSNRQDQVRTMLSESLRAVISQRLVPTADESGRVPALEVLVINKAIANLIRDEKTIQIRSAMQTGSALGMYLLEQSLAQLVASGQVAKEEALRLAEDPKLLG